MENINVEQIMAEIRKEIKENGMTVDIPRFDDVPLRDDDTLSVNMNPEADHMGVDPDARISRLESESTVQYYYPMPRGLKNTVKKVIRKTVHCVFFPIMESQNQFNRDIVSYLKLSRQAEHKKNKAILKRLQQLENENKKLQEQLYNKQTGKDGMR